MRLPLEAGNEATASSVIFVQPQDSAEMKQHTVVAPAKRPQLLVGRQHLCRDLIDSRAKYEVHISPVVVATWESPGWCDNQMGCIQLCTDKELCE